MLPVSNFQFCLNSIERSNVQFCHFVEKLQRVLESYHNLEKPPEGELYFESETERAAFIENFKAEARLRAQLDISEEEQEKFEEHIAKRKKQINDRIKRVKDFERLLTQLNTKLQINCVIKFLIFFSFYYRSIRK